MRLGREKEKGVTTSLTSSVVVRRTSGVLLVLPVLIGREEGTSGVSSVFRRVQLNWDLSLDMRMRSETVSRGS